MTHTTTTVLPTYHSTAGTGPTLVFLHYWGGSSRTWAPVVDRVTGRATVRIDFRGWGRSSDLPGPYDLHRLAADTLGVIAELGLTDYIVIGHSMGGKVAQLLAATRPEGLAGIVLVASGPAEPAAEVTPDYQEALSHAYDTAESVAAARDHILTATDLTEAAKLRVVQDSLAGAPDARAEWPLRGIAENITDEATRIDVPTLVIGGERDQVEPVDVLRQNLLPYLPDAEFVVIPRTGHLIPLEAPDELTAAIAAFSDRVASSSTSNRLQ